jgi:phospholipid/cholesterol/gamma-HCH transport system substrate-binding protein
MTERQLQFRVGLFVIVALVVSTVMIFHFGKLTEFWEPRYMLAIHFDSAPGVYRSTPVRRNGVAIGQVSNLRFDDKQGGVLVLVDIREEFRLRTDAHPRLVRSLLGDASIDFVPGKSRKFLRPGTRLKGETSADPLEIVNRLEGRLNLTLQTFRTTSREWEQVGRKLNNLMETDHGQLNLVVERAATALHQFTITMRSADKTFGQANKMLGDPQNQENLRKTLAALPELVAETQKTIAMVNLAIEKADENLSNLTEVTAPLAKRSVSIITKLDRTLGNLESLSGELVDFSRTLAKKDGSIQKFISDPELYHNLNRSASSLAVLLKNIEPIVRDLRIFSDKVARHPELIGVSGALKGSSGLKDPPQPAPQQKEPYRQSRGRSRVRLQRR